ncbi:uncharacterized protein ARMOST_20382 [Armillaria ostoyae]|uniref:Protein kinase domain-containing protein n=1 Tax=Armillaria ostoyae TaxID=47428 RepID=A0A284S760_ARMOS|nr:uncharacterized protein ARMOST_20382 [Armillaria ostoyae]
MIPTDSECRLLNNVAQMEMDAEMPFRFRIMIWSDGDDFFHLKSPIRRPLDEKEERSALSYQAILVPRTYYQTAPPADLIRAPHPIPEDAYIKIGRPFYFDADDPESGAIWPTMVHEARICEVLMKHPHRNVAEYYGYVEKDGLMAGLCFKRYGQTLRDAVEKGTLNTGDIEFVLEEIEKGIQHIHALGLVHNDINPANILLDADNATPIIIDFDSCYKKGASMDYNGGTFPWSNDARIAEFENDDFGLDKTIGSFYDEENYPHPPSPESNLTSSVSQSATKDPEKTTATTTVFSTTTQSLGTESPPSSSVSSTTPTSSHALLILGSVLGVIAFISSLLFLLFLFLRRRKKRRNNADRESQIPEPYCQGKVPPSQTSQGQDQGEVLRDRERLGELEETLRLLLNNQHQHSIMGSEIDPQPPPDYASASSGVDGPFQVSRIS